MGPGSADADKEHRSEVQQGSGDGRPPVAMRADARRNRAHILAAAEEVFAEQGVAVPIDEVARRAEVGVGTLYRHFPTKEALFEAVIAHHIERLTEEARAVAGSEHPGQALFELLGRLAEEATSKRSLVDSLSGAGINVKATNRERKRAFEDAVEVLLDRAQRAGEVRPDVTLADLVGLVMGACSVAGPDATGCSRGRMMAVVCDGLRPSHDPGDLTG